MTQYQYEQRMQREVWLVITLFAILVMCLGAGYLHAAESYLTVGADKSFLKSTHAEPYIGAGVALAITDVETNCPECTTYDTHKLAVKPTLFAGWREGQYAIETGLGYAAYRGHAIVPSRPADVRQEIDSRFLYVSALRFVPMATGEAFIGAGAARVSARNHEHGLTQRMDGSTGQVENLTYTRETAPIFMAGYQYESLRVSLSVIPNVVRSVWTKQQDIYNVSLAWVWK